MMSELNDYDPNQGIEWWVRINPRYSDVVEVRVEYEFSDEHFNFIVDPADLARFLRENFPEVME
jgi:hypothetical protein